jgi:hypothetical protein
MVDQPNDAVTNAADLMINYTDDEIKAEVWAHIREIVREVVRDEVRNHMADPSVGERLIVNHAFVFNKQVLRAMKEFFANNQQIY